jgi:hypothetical protein
MPDFTPPLFIGYSARGYKVVEDQEIGLRYGLTKCCGASAKGSWSELKEEGVVVCRSCYREVDEELGGPMEPVAEVSVECGVCGVETMKVPAHQYHGQEDLCESCADRYGSL